MRTIVMCYRPDRDFTRQVTRGVIDYSRRSADVTFRIVWRPSTRELSRLNNAGLIGLSTQDALIEKALELGIPYAGLGSSPKPPRVATVATEEEQLGRMAAEHFAELGLKHFGYTGHRPWPFVVMRGESFARALQNMGFPAPARHVRAYYARGRQIDLEGNLKRWLLRLPRPCGVLVASDYNALDVITAAVHAGLRVPDDIAVLSVDNEDIISALSPVAISSIAQPAYMFGYEAARLLHEAWDAGRNEPKIVRLPPVRVVSRASTDLVAMEDEDVAQAVRLIRDHAHEPIDVTWVVSQLPLSRRSLERKFRQLVGQTMLDRIHQVRFAKVKELLAETDLPLKIIAPRTGMNNAKWLSDSFRKYVGITTSEYRGQFRPTHQDESDEA